MKINLNVYLLAIGLIIGNLSVNAQQENFTLTVKIGKTVPSYKAFLFYTAGPESFGLDSAECIDGKFRFVGKTLRPQRAYVFLAPGNMASILDARKERIPVYLEKGDILVSSIKTLTEAKLSGTPKNDEFQHYTDLLQTPNPKLAQEQYFLAHLDSSVSLDWLESSVNIAQDKSTALKLFNKMTDRVKNSASGQRYGKLLNATASVEVGGTAPDFKSKDLQNKEVLLNSFRGKYVLLDFWASWCVPCRRENPNVLKAYNAFKPKNFTVVGYSLDESKDKWADAVAKDGLPWVQLSDLQGSSVVSRLYGVTSIPTNFLIDPKGKIVAKNLRGEELEKVLSKLL